MMESERTNRLLQYLEQLDVIESTEIPTIDLYMDQLTTFMDQRLTQYRRNEEDKILTKTMINNYTKSKVLSMPVKKKYSKEQLEKLIAIYHLKQILSLTDIHDLFEHLIDYDDFYEAFIHLQKENKQNMQKEVVEALKKAQDTSHSNDEKTNLMLFALSLAIQGNVAKQLAEKILDEFKK